MDSMTIAKQYSAAGWSDTAAAELAHIHIGMHAKKGADRAAAQAVALAALVAPHLPAEATGHGLGGLPRPPLRRALALLLVSCLLWLSACGGGGDSGAIDEFAQPTKTTQPLNCHATPEICK